MSKKLFINEEIELFFRHLKDEVDFKILDDLENKINEYMNYYNNCRYQLDLKNMLPIQYRDYILVV